jgi:hypothetical protein
VRVTLIGVSADVEDHISLRVNTLPGIGYNFQPLSMMSWYQSHYQPTIPGRLPQCHSESIVWQPEARTAVVQMLPKTGKGDLRRKK